jgi:hypothetical protein
VWNLHAAAAAAVFHFSLLPQETVTTPINNSLFWIPDEFLNSRELAPYSSQKAPQHSRGVPSQVRPVLYYHEQ